jgi:hypothetical protein
VPAEGLYGQAWVCKSGRMLYFWCLTIDWGVHWGLSKTCFADCKRQFAGRMHMNFLLPSVGTASSHLERGWHLTWMWHHSLVSGSFEGVVTCHFVHAFLVFKQRVRVSMASVMLWVSLFVPEAEVQAHMALLYCPRSWQCGPHWLQPVSLNVMTLGSGLMAVETSCG